MMKVFLVDVSGEGPLHNGEVLWKNAWTEGDVVIRGYRYENYNVLVATHIFSMMTSLQHMYSHTWCWLTNLQFFPPYTQ
jgi:hypothetical protein